MISDSLLFLHGCRLPECRAVVDKHFDSYYTLQFMAAGRLRLRYDRREHLLSGRWVWPTMPGPKIFFSSQLSSQPWDHRYLAFQGSLVESWRAEGLWPVEPQPAPPEGEFDELFDRMLGYMDDPRRISRLRAINILERLLLDLMDSRSQVAESSQAWLGFVLEVLADPTRHPVDYAALAASLGMSPGTLRRRFRDKVGVTLHQYALASRMTVARTMLLESDRPIKAIAGVLGFRDVYFFSRQFRQIVGMPPGEFRKSAT